MIDAARSAELLGAGHAARIAELIGAMPEVTPQLRLVLADALRMTGDVAGAQRAFQPLLDEASRTGQWTAGLAWRAGMLCYLRSDYRAALAVLDRAHADDDEPTADDVSLHACRAATYGQLGDTAAAEASADLAVTAATRTGDDRALATARTAAAVTASGARRHEHLAAGLAAAERAGDLVQQARILVNQADLLLREARYPEALDAAARAVRTAPEGSPPGVRVVALHNAGEALTRLGRYEEAIDHFERSMHLSRRFDLNRAAAGLCGLAEARRQLGQREQSRSGFAEAAELARESGDLQVLVPALAGLARLAGLAVDDVEEARAAAEEAERVAPPYLKSCALTARGWAALAQSDPARAHDYARAAVSAARAARQADALANALELQAGAGVEADAARSALTEAATIWRRSGAEPAADRILVQLGALAGADGPARLAGRQAAARLVALGVPGTLAAFSVRVCVLGRFEVAVGGRTVPLPAWRSKQARTLLKILVARRGRPVPRGELCDLLWPDDDPQRTAHRLSVLLLAVRAVLDPARRAPADHYVRADAAGLSLNLEQVSVDAEDLLADVAHGVRLAAAGDLGGSREALSAADATYRGDVFDDEPYSDWADGLREQVRAAWLRALHGLARLCRRAGESEQAAHHLVRLLAADPYDEAAHRGLVEVLAAAGRHGEARRAFARWTRSMQAIDAPVPDPAPVLIRGPAT